MFINPRFVLIIRVGRADIPWTKLRFETKSHINTPFVSWVSQRLSNSAISKKITKISICKALNIAKAVSIQRRHYELKFFISYSSRNIHFRCSLEVIVRGYMENR